MLYLQSILKIKKLIIKKLFVVGPYFKSFSIPYLWGCKCLNVIITKGILKNYRQKELNTVSEILSLSLIPETQHGKFLDEYLLNNTWNLWRMRHLESAQDFNKICTITNLFKVDDAIHNGMKIIFLYPHDFMVHLHSSFMIFGIKKDFVSLGNITDEKFLKLNNQNDLPDFVRKEPLKYKAIVRKNQIRKMLDILNSPNAGIINYFFDGQEGKNFLTGKIGNLKYRLSKDLTRLIRPDIVFYPVMTEIKPSGKIEITINDKISYNSIEDLIKNILAYYESNFLINLPRLNHYMINQILKNHYAIENNL